MYIFKQYRKLFSPLLNLTLVENGKLNQDDLGENNSFGSEDIQHVNKELLKIMLDNKLEDSEISSDFISAINETKDQLSNIDKNKLADSVLKHIHNKGGLIISSVSSFNKIFDLLSALKGDKFGKENLFAEKIAGFINNKRNYKNIEKALDNGYKVQLTGGQLAMGISTMVAIIKDHKGETVNLEHALASTAEYVDTITTEENSETQEDTQPALANDNTNTLKSELIGEISQEQPQEIMEEKEAPISSQLEGIAANKLSGKKVEVNAEDIFTFKNEITGNPSIHPEKIYSIFQLLGAEENNNLQSEKTITSFRITEKNRDKFLLDLFEANANFYIDQNLITIGAKISYDGSKLFVDSQEIVFKPYPTDGYKNEDTLESDKIESIYKTATPSSEGEKEALEYMENSQAMSDLVNNEGEYYEADNGDTDEYPNEVNSDQKGTSDENLITQQNIIIQCESNAEIINNLINKLAESQEKNAFNISEINELSDIIITQITAIEQLQETNTHKDIFIQQLEVQVNYYSQVIFYAMKHSEYNYNVAINLQQQNFALQKQLESLNIKNTQLENNITELNKIIAKKDETIETLEEKNTDLKFSIIDQEFDNLDSDSKRRETIKKQSKEINNLENFVENQIVYTEDQDKKIQKLENNLTKSEQDLNNEKKKAQEHLIEDQKKSDNILQNTLKFSKRLPEKIKGYSNPEKPTTEEILNILQEIFDNCGAGKTGHGIDKTYYKANKEKVDFTLQVALTALGINVGSIDANSGRNTKNGVGKFQKKHNLDYDKDAGADVYSMLIADIEAQYEI